MDLALIVVPALSPLAAAGARALARRRQAADQSRAAVDYLKALLADAAKTGQSRTAFPTGAVTEPSNLRSVDRAVVRSAGVIGRPTTRRGSDRPRLDCAA